MKVVVVGGGIAGLAATYRLEALGADPTVVERDGLPGGKIRTERVDGFVIEEAPDSFLARKERGIGLCEELGLDDELIGRRPENQRTFVRRGRGLHLLPEGLTGMIPANLDALERTELLSREAKARFAMEPEVPALEGDGDESVASFVSRRFGREAYEALVEPLMTGIYGGDGEQLSLRSTFPQLRALELEHGSVLRGLTGGSASGGREPFLSLRSGMDRMVTRLVERLVRTRVILGETAASVTRTPTGYALVLAGGETLGADALVLATPAHSTAEMVGALDPELAAAHAEIPYASSVVISLAFADGVTAPDGYGYVVPQAEGSDVLACTWTSQKWVSRAPEGAALVRVYAGRFGGRDLTREADDELVALARDELRLQEVVAEPRLTRVHRWPRGMPQYVLGHPERLERIDELLTAHPGLALAGAAYRGVGIPDCIASGEGAAESVVRAVAGTSA